MTGASPPLRVVVLGLSLSSSWGNGHATTYRALLRAFAARGHEVLFLERDVPWYADHRDLPDPAWCRLQLYRDLPHLERWAEQGAVDRVFWNKAGDAGLLCISIPEEYGGGGGTFAHEAVIAEEQTRAFLADALDQVAVEAARPMLDAAVDRAWEILQ